MPIDWKTKIDDYYTVIKEKRTEQTRKIKRDQADQRQKKHEKKYRCHACPKNNRTTSTGAKQPEYALQPSGVEKPSGLTKCSLCGKWTCDDCLHRGICKVCAAKPPLSAKFKRRLGLNWLPDEKTKN